MVRVTVPVNPLTELTVIMDMSWAPRRMFKRDGLADTLKLFRGPVTIT